MMNVKGKTVYQPIFTLIAGCIGLCGKQCMRDVPPKLAIYFKLLAIWVEKLETSDPPKLAI